ncbi:hypothetical protein [Granulicella sibirica]|uniref:Uncharacterized protein n=1 Tax=Granulicella sibirica TaxID=2479048 RepID=A0A4Q0T2Y1_9BACT|nr:hypothetical protein [Granulicella sibirica]RXH56299.1 hypothetical protein GRAN_3156 [Granulicella sibirica]
MTTAKKAPAKKTAKKASAKKTAKKDNPCWDGYEPTPGKKPGTKGSCKPED